MKSELESVNEGPKRNNSFQMLGIVMRWIFVIYSALMMLFISAHSWIAVCLMVLCILVFLTPKKRLIQSIGIQSSGLMEVIAGAILVLFVCKPYQIPISTSLLLSKDEGEGYLTNYYSVSYYAPNSPVLFVRVDTEANHGVRLAHGWVRYSPLDFASMSHQRVIVVKNLAKGVQVLGAKAGKS
jgi:hypothetical protein